MKKTFPAKASFFHQFLTYLIIFIYVAHRTECFKDSSNESIDKTTESTGDFYIEEDEEEDSTGESSDIFTGESASSSSESGPMIGMSTSRDTINESPSILPVAKAIQNGSNLGLLLSLTLSLQSHNISSPITPKNPIGFRLYKFTSSSPEASSINLTRSMPHFEFHALLCEKTMVIVSFDKQKKLRYCEMFDLEKRRPEAYNRVSNLRLKVSPASLSYVRSVIKECESMEIDEMSRRAYSDPNSAQAASSLTLSSFLYGIVPGTKWCGLGDIARNYSDIGRIWQVDICCRIHDHCPLRLAGLSQDYGLMNYSFNTRSHCNCDEDFYRCLTNADTVPLATAIRNLYFSPLAPTRCFRSTEPTDCRTPSSGSSNPMCQAKNQKFSYSAVKVVSKSIINQS